MTIKIMPVRMTIIIVTTLVVSEAMDTTDTCCGSIFWFIGNDVLGIQVGSTSAAAAWQIFPSADVLNHGCHRPHHAYETPVSTTMTAVPAVGRDPPRTSINVMRFKPKTTGDDARQLMQGKLSLVPPPPHEQW